MKARHTPVAVVDGKGASGAFVAASRGAVDAFWRAASALSAAAVLIIALGTAQVVFSAEPAGASKNAAQNIGQLTYDKWCAPCHAPGPDHPGTQALDALYRGTKPGALIERRDLTPPIVKQFVRKGVSVMPFFRKTEISDAELDALSAFLAKQK
jgi:mono/diheme cytochrome c family protein